MHTHLLLKIIGSDIKFSRLLWIERVDDGEYESVASRLMGCSRLGSPKDESTVHVFSVPSTSFFSPAYVKILIRSVNMYQTH